MEPWVSGVTLRFVGQLLMSANCTPPRRKEEETAVVTIRRGQLLPAPSLCSHAWRLYTVKPFNRWEQPQKAMTRLIPVGLSFLLKCELFNLLLIPPENSWWTPRLPETPRPGFGLSRLRLHVNHGTIILETEFNTKWRKGSLNLM